MKILKNRFFYAIIALLLALFLCFVVAPFQYQDMDSLTEVVKVRTEVAPGTTLSAEMLTVVKVGAYGLDRNAVTSLDQAVGYVALTDLSPRDPIYRDELVSADSYRSDGMEHLIGEGQSLISISMSSPAASVSGLPKPGDLVDVFYAHTATSTDEFGYSTKKTTVMHPELLKNMVVYAVMNSNLTSTTASGGSSDSVPAVVTLVATPEQEMLLVELEHSGADAIHLVLKESR